MTTYTPSKYDSGGSVLALLSGIVIAMGVFAVVMVLARHPGYIKVSPQEETDRRIDELEKSIHNLQSSFSNTVKS